MKIKTARLRRCAPWMGASVLVAAISCAAARPSEHPDGDSQAHVKMVAVEPNDSMRYLALTADDYSDVADELGISVAAIRAVVDIEAGPGGRGFNSDNTPVINFDLTMFRQAARKRGININRFKSSHAVVFNAPDRRKYGSQQAAQYARLHSAMQIDTIAALEGTFWGMFQIGGFNWKICGCGSVREFVHLMSYSEREQLELFASFLRARNLIPYLQKKEWAKFSLRYNGPGYKKHGYDTRMAAAYAKYSK